MRKLVSMTTEVAKAREAIKGLGRSRDEDYIAMDLYNGKTVRTVINGQTVTGTVFAVANAGFRGIEVHIWVGKGSSKVHRIVPMGKCRVWAER